jgi:hypothetical protein
VFAATATTSTTPVASVSTAASCTAVGGANNGVYTGATSCGQGTIATLTVNGPLSLSQTTVSQNLTVNGPLDADHATLNTVTANGPLNANYTTFSGDLTLSGEATFSYSKLQNIVVPNSSKASPVNIYLEGNTTVQNITVEQGKAYVFLGKGAKVKGKVQGAKVMKLKH